MSHELERESDQFIVSIISHLLHKDEDIFERKMWRFFNFLVDSGDIFSFSLTKLFAQLRSEVFIKIVNPRQTLCPMTGFNHAEMIRKMNNNTSLRKKWDAINFELQSDIIRSFTEFVLLLSLKT